jgi:hypothetical protein
MSANLQRRQFISLSTVLAGLVATAGPLAPFLSEEAWAREVRSLNDAQAATLVAMMRTIAPHDGLEEEAYRLVSRAVESMIGGDEGLRALVGGGLDALGPHFASQAEPERVAALRAIQDGPFFKFVRVQTLFNLYGSPIAYAHFGYEGEAFSKGGYLTRGFDSLDWLPDVPLEDSGPNPARAGR